MIHFYPLKVKEVKRETTDCVSIAFDVPEALTDKFIYRHGQYLTLRTYINGDEVRRSYSICSSPLDNELRIAVKRVDAGIFSRYANEHLKQGDTIEAMPPIGRFFTELNASHKKSYVAIAAGSGITPVLSIIRTTLFTELHSRFTLVYGNRTRQSIIFKEEIEALKNRFINRFSVIHILSREQMDTPLNAGRIDKEKAQLIFEKTVNAKAVDDFFICGPEEMINHVRETLAELGVEKQRVHSEFFSTGSGKKTADREQKTVVKGGAKSNVTIRLDGSSFDFELGFDDDSILNAALKKGADLPFACKSGVCCTCRAKLVEGAVEMDVNYGLEPEEVEAGFILTCQSHPTTARVVVDFDLK